MNQEEIRAELVADIKTALREVQQDVNTRNVYMNERDTKLLENRQSPGIDGTSEEYLTDCGVQVELEASHAIIKRFKEAA